MLDQRTLWVFSVPAITDTGLKAEEPMSLRKLNTVALGICILVLMAGCGNKMSRLEDKLRRAIYESNHARIKNQIQAQFGYEIEIDKIQIKATYKEIYTYLGVVTFKRRDRLDESKRMALPKLGSLPSTNLHSGVIRVRFKYLEEEDRWYFDQYV